MMSVQCLLCPWLCLFFWIVNDKVVDALCSNNRIVWFRPHALRTHDNPALRLALESIKDQKQDTSTSSSHGLRFVYLWDQRKDPSGGTASDVFVVHALDALNKTLKGCLDVVDCASHEENIDSSSKSMSMAEALVDYAEDWFADDNSKIELLYLETFDHQLESEIYHHLTKKERPQLLVRPMKGGQTLLDYTYPDTTTSDPELDPVRLVKDAIERHPFASPLIPFVDSVVNYMGKNPPSKVQPIDLEVLSGDGHHKPSTSQRKVSLLSIKDMLQKAGTTRTTNWGVIIAERWPATEEAAAEALDNFVKSQYPSLVGIKRGKHETGADQSDSRRTHLASHLSPYLARGLLSPRQVHQKLWSVQNHDKQNSFLRRIAWRDYAYAVSTVFPEQPIRRGYEDSSDNNHSDANTKEALKKWTQGKTGFPLVDAGMRQLTQEGFMPQQVRLSVSACLVEGLNVPWRAGMEHFEQYLVDYDKVINGHMWMNAAGVGLDPYYIGLDYKKRPYWDADGAYVRKWCPELRYLPDRIEVPPTTPGTGGTNAVDALYTPWKAPPDVLEKSGVVPGSTYPHRICDEREGRQTFLQKLRHCRASWPDAMIDSSGNDVIEIGGEMIGTFTPRSIKVRDRSPQASK